MNFEFDWLSLATFLATAANVVAVIVIVIHASWLKRKEKTERKRANVRRRDQVAQS